MISNRPYEDNTVCINNIKEKDKSKCVDNILTMMYFKEENKLINNNWTRKKLSRYFGKIILYLKYVKSGYYVVINMYI